MAASGNARDAEFAEGLLTVLSGHSQLLKGTSEHSRPKADLGQPFGRVAGDVCCLYRKPNSDETRMLIVEREGSAPGNERNILKWYRALSNGKSIWVDNQNGPIQCDVSNVVLLLAFGRPTGWDTSDFEKTVAFCELLGSTLNENTAIPMTIHVNKFPGVVEDWKECGRHFGTIAAEIL